MNENSVSDKNWIFMFIVFLFFLFITSCTNKPESARQNLPDTNPMVSEVNRYARGFSITKFGDFDIERSKSPGRDQPSLILNTCL